MANSSGSDANSSSRRCLTLVNVTTPTAPNAVLPTKFAVAEKHIDGFSPARELHLSPRNAKYFLLCGAASRRQRGLRALAKRAMDFGTQANFVPRCMKYLR